MVKKLNIYKKITQCNKKLKFNNQISHFHSLYKIFKIYYNYLETFALKDLLLKFFNLSRSSFLVSNQNIILKYKILSFLF